ncbi:serine threonine phosphatase pp2a-associated [Pyrrhoderma noxium]|uniref:Serine threonine phosphatase pp2a-associated n=1 Tax=Pyrrhoderma noxium TaxID=2282107 RepID=A0A286UWC1_9AGAM|nr:serine threonine phosphatase pp2a-associated [Pyrrhoderma noxium]
MSEEEASISLIALYSRALKAASNASSLPTIEDDTQAVVNSALKDLNLLSARVQSLNLFSPNEALDELSTRNLLYITLPFILAEVELHARSTKRDERLERLRRAYTQLRTFIGLLEAYKVIPEEEKKLFQQKSSSVIDPATRREIKISQFKKEKEIKNRISAIRQRNGKPEIDMSNNYDLVESLLPVGSNEEDGDEDAPRETTLLLLRLQWAQACTHLESIGQELELLANAPPEEPADEDARKKDGEDSSWRLDAPTPNQQGPLLDASGRPLRPFTILPSGAAERARLQGQVFRPDHRLPTMSIDEYLEEERRRGNIISGGGPQSAAAPTRKEQLAVDSEMDGTLEGEEKAEKKRAEDEKWAQFTDANPRGAGNTMNRG